MSAHVPAWKRLGLKLKGPASAEAIPSSGSPNARAKPSAQVPNPYSNAHAHAHAQNGRVNGSPASALKRKQPGSAPAPNAALSAQTPSKKQRKDNGSAPDQATIATPSSLKKSVSFSDGTKSGDKAKKNKPKTKAKKAKKAAEAAQADFSLEPSLVYLRQWHTARDSWKFNKNHQTLLIKYLFDGDKIPSTDVPIFYQYIRDLKGFVRTRLRETATDIQHKDMEAGAGAFPAALKDKETKQKEYEDTIARFLRDLHQYQEHQQKEQQANGTLSKHKNANGKRTLDEVEYVLRVGTPEIKQRLLKRIRAELVLDSLSDSEDSTSTTTSAADSVAGTSTTSTTTITAGTAVAARRSDGQPAKRRRLRNVRTDIGDQDDDSSESSSSESEDESNDDDEEDEEDESDSDDDDSSSTSSSESEESEEGDAMDVDQAPGGQVDDSSSSSSSSSEDEDDDDDEGDDDDDNDEAESGAGVASASDEESDAVGSSSGED
ncbi:hypothetical protein B0J18DRAFT_426746 [Chaetomium sp. MPI-SDFR-AT-0129]|nr:hypothetical protein B0J18DRAFT_426746 [Chaetomium sp. MPI-SDFR-AT-0129]